MDDFTPIHLVADFATLVGTYAKGFAVRTCWGGTCGSNNAATGLTTVSSSVHTAPRFADSLFKADFHELSGCKVQPDLGQDRSDLTSVSARL